LAFFEIRIHNQNSLQVVEVHMRVFFHFVRHGDCKFSVSWIGVDR
jgi:hypothetical protein